MINPFKQVNWNPDYRELRTFARSLMIGFPVIALLISIAQKINHGTWNVEFPCKLAGIGLASGLVFFVFPFVARPFYLVWYALSCAIGLVVSNALFVVLYYTFFTGTGILRRMFRKSPIKKGLNPATPTFWLDAGEPPPPKRYYNQF
jgi:hypothetical protein